MRDRQQDLTREPEQIKAYRDTWTLGIHSYLAYMRDRLIVAKKLLTDSGSIFVQISNENVHRVRCILDEVFGNENFVSLVPFTKTTARTAKYLNQICDYLIWYSKDLSNLKYRQLFSDRIGHDNRFNKRDEEGKYYYLRDSSSPGAGNREPFEFRGRIFTPPPGKHWSTNPNLLPKERIEIQGNYVSVKVYKDDFPVSPIHNNWTDTQFGGTKHYVVQTHTKVIQRCLLMTTDPGDLVLDPTCGSGTTAYVAEQWGRRWITIDTSRVAVALARQRLLTGTFDYYKLKDESKGIVGGFINKIVPHITPGGIARNTALDPIFAKHEPILKEKLETLNRTLAEITPDIRTKLLAKLADKQRREGKRAITAAALRRWQLPQRGEVWQEWEVPFDTDPDWPEALREALTDYREAFRAKMDEVNACITASSDSEELVDQPKVDRKRMRVSGPFTVEAVQPAEESLYAADELESPPTAQDVGNAEAYLEGMIRLLRKDGVRFPDNRTLKFATLEPLEGGILHAEGNWEGAERSGGDSPAKDVYHETSFVDFTTIVDGGKNLAVVFGPQYGPVTAMQVEQCTRAAYRRGYDNLVFAGFSFDGAAQAVIQDDLNPDVRIHMAHINPDVAMGDLLKDSVTSQLFTVFGLPRTALKTAGCLSHAEHGDKHPPGEYIVKMEGVDIYNPVDNTVSAAGADKVAAWFIDADYDGRTFCITQAFFPDKKAWNKIARALKGVIDEERFEKFSGTESFPFAAGEHACVAVKVIDPRGNEVMSVHALKS